MHQFPDSDPYPRLFELLSEKSFFTGDFTLASGKKSNYYIDCRLTTLDPAGACLVGAAVRQTIKSGCEQHNTTVSGIGGLTLGADPIALAASMASHVVNDNPALKPFVVRKEPKGHGKGKQIEGGFKSGDQVVAIDDVITSGGSTLQAIDVIEKAGGVVAFVVVLVDRQEGGRENIEKSGYPVLPLFTRDQLLAAV
jgi:orotate phosphoribosyltransferase